MQKCSWVFMYCLRRRCWHCGMHIKNTKLWCKSFMIHLHVWQQCFHVNDCPIASLILNAGFTVTLNGKLNSTKELKKEKELLLPLKCCCWVVSEDKWLRHHMPTKTLVWFKQGTFVVCHSLPQSVFMSCFFLFKENPKNTRWIESVKWT